MLINRYLRTVGYLILMLFCLGDAFDMLLVSQLLDLLLYNIGLHFISDDMIAGNTENYR